MFEKLLAGVALSLLSFGAIAADIPKRTAVRAPASVYGPAPSWTGFYVGAEAGYGFGKYRDALTCNSERVGSISSNAGSGSGCEAETVAVTGLSPLGSSWETRGDGTNIRGLAFGARLGFNYQMDRFVLGAETGLLGSGMKNDSSILLTTGSFSGRVYDVSGQVGWIARFTGKAGYLVTPALLVSVNGGVALAESSLKSSAGYSSSDTTAGWTLGTEAEYKLTPSLSLTAKYAFMKFDDLSYRGSSLFGLIDNVHGYDLNINMVTAGFNYQFDGMRNGSMVTR